jgi:NitT/TauT family transport system substrate-binding protein
MTRNRMRAFAVLAAVALGVTGCAAGSSQQASTNDNGTANIVVGYPAIGASFADQYVGIDNGIFKANGLNVTLKRVEGAAQLIPALKSGSINIALGPATSGATAALAGTDVRFIAMSAKVYNLEVYARKDFPTVESLKGHTFGVAPVGSESDVGLTDLLAKHGLARTDVKVVRLASQDAQLSALAAGSVDAIMTQPPLSAQAAKSGAHQLEAMSDLPFGLGSYFVTSDYMAKNTDVLKKFVKAETAALAYLRSNPAETKAAISKYTTVTDQAQVSAAYDFFQGVWAKVPDVPTDLIQVAFKTSAASANKPAPADVGQYIAYPNLAG